MQYHQQQFNSSQDVNNSNLPASVKSYIETRLNEFESGAEVIIAVAGHEEENASSFMIEIRKA